ncbi:MAG TPA: hypothetical protein VHR41_20755 [Gemmatimonadales bacterium]|nr:hypothetical protein [Gemmatimonadales bacterium]
MRSIVVLAAAVALPGPTGVHPLHPPVDFRYTAAQLQCARFEEISRGRVLVETAGRRRQETVGRSGRWSLRASDSAAGIALVGWYDSLSVWREGAAGMSIPDTDGLLGGRYRGVLTPAGGYSGLASPFVPAEVAEVVELGGALQDLLPPLPTTPLEVGQRWADTSGVELRRLPDSMAAGRVVQRLHLRARAESQLAAVRGDTLSIPTHQVTVEDGQLDWVPQIGLVRWVRHIVVESIIPAGGPVPQPIRSKLEQDVRLSRLTAPAGSRPGACP